MTRPEPEIHWRKLRPGVPVDDDEHQEFLERVWKARKGDDHTKQNYAAILRRKNNGGVAEKGAFNERYYGFTDVKGDKRPDVDCNHSEIAVLGAFRGGGKPTIKPEAVFSDRQPCDPKTTAGCLAAIKEAAAKNVERVTVYYITDYPGPKKAEITAWWRQGPGRTRRWWNFWRKRKRSASPDADRPAKATRCSARAARG